MVIENGAGSRPVSVEEALAFAVEAAGPCPRDGRAEWLDEVVALAGELPTLRQRIAAVLANAPIKAVRLTGVLESVEVRPLGPNGDGRAFIYFRPDQASRYGSGPERLSTEWLSTSEGQRIYQQAVQLTGQRVAIVRSSVPKKKNGQVVRRSDGTVETTSRVVAIEALSEDRSEQFETRFSPTSNNVNRKEHHQ
jgi:hypothetical protein